MRSAVELTKSAIGESMPRRSSAGSGIGHMPSPTRLPAATTASRRSSVPMTPAVRPPSATTCAPVSVEVSSR